MNLINFKDTTIQGTVVTVFILIVAVVILKAQDFIRFNEFALAAAFVFIVLLISCATMLFFSRKLINEWTTFARDLRDTIGALDRRFDIVAVTAKADWLVANDHLMKIEKTVKCHTVYIITASLDEEIDDKQYAPIIKNNLKRGIKYHYLVPDDPVLQSRAAHLKTKLSNPDGLSFEFFKDPLFRIISLQDVAIYCADTSAHAYMNLPIREGGTAYFLELGHAQTETLVAHLQKFLTAAHGSAKASG